MFKHLIKRRAKGLCLIVNIFFISIENTSAELFEPSLLESLKYQARYSACPLTRTLWGNTN